MRTRLWFAGFWLSAAALLAQGPKLAIVRAVLHQYENGPAVAGGTSFIAGDTVFFSFHLSGFKVGDESKIDLHWRADVVDPQGVPGVEAIEKDIRTQISPEDKNWTPVADGSAQMPPLIFPGTYHIRLSAEDRLSGQKTSADLSVTVRGRAIEPSDTLVVRDFRFPRAEDDRFPMNPAVYRPGDAIWGKFVIAGFKYGEKNHIHVEYGISVLAPSGKVLYSQPTAAVEDDTSFYPKRYLPGALSLALGKDFRPGTYTVVLNLRDEVGKTAVEERYTFSVQ